MSLLIFCRFIDSFQKNSYNKFTVVRNINGESGANPEQTSGLLYISQCPLYYLFDMQGMRA